MAVVISGRSYGLGAIVALVVLLLCVVFGRDRSRIDALSCAGADCSVGTGDTVVGRPIRGGTPHA
jgi:hypothetical protein